MFKENNNIIFSPTDLTTFMSSPFASWMNRFKMEFPADAPQCDEVDALSSLLSKKGLEHEDNMLTLLQEQGKSVCVIKSEVDGKKLTIDKQKSASIAAMQQGVDVIFQAVLEHASFRGHADFLIKVPGSSTLGDYHYEVWDTKLANKVKPYFVIQLCCYAEMLEAIQGVLPQNIVVALGNGENESLRTEDYYFYYKALKTQFIDYQSKFNPSNHPDPSDSKEYGRWSNYAEQLFVDKDHLIQVANITRSQIKKLNQAGIITCEQLVATKLERVSGLNSSILSALKAQANIQKQSNGQMPPLFEIKHHEKHKQQGLALLPPHSDLDVFFDIEGYPLDEGGLEYLWGNTYFDEQGTRQFIDFWAHDAEQEKVCFKAFIDWVYARWQQDPSMHIYHYASYEITACRKLMSRYGICENEVDQLLRNEVFIDLYKVVKGGLLVGEPKYSIKNVEHLYRGKRETEVGSGGDSVVVYEHWRDNFQKGLDGGTWQTSKTLNAIRDYNIDDCDSTQELVAWLRLQQANNAIEFVGKTDVVEPEISEEVSERTQLRDRLLQRAEQERIAGKESEAKISENLAWTLEFHRREAKPVFWKLFDRLGSEIDVLMDDMDCLANCVRTSLAPFKPSARARNLAYEYTFDIEQEFKNSSSNYYVLGEVDENGKNISVSTNKEHSDLEKGTIVLTSRHELPSLVTLIPNEYVRPEPIPSAITAVIKEYENGIFEGTAIADFLLKRSPRIKGRKHNKEAIVTADNAQERLAQIINAVENLDNSYLAIQGPPGTGKTYTGKHIIAALVKSGKRVGIASNSHKAINNLLAGVAQYCNEQNIAANCYCTKDTGNEISENQITVIKNAEIAKNATQGCVIGTTAWGFCKDEVENCFDYLFIDEAGQVSVANLIGMSRATNNIVLMGDQMQLGQPSQGTHPGESGLSILDYLLNDTPIMPAHMGVFLDTTYRMHSKVNHYISNAIYEGQLKTDVDNDKQCIEVPDNYQGALNQTAGVILVPVEHQGNTQASIEEVNVIKLHANELLGRRYTNKEGKTSHITWDDMLFVAPYNHQVSKLKIALGEQAKVGSVDKFQGQEAPIVFFSLCSSDASESARGIDFLFDKHRINVAISRAQSMAIVVANPSLFNTPVNSIKQLAKVNVLSRLLFE
ncbi:helicase [Colwellia sp. MT41]|uniref:Nuclease n=1 Tax=Colwellia marinimaniae TaxID=1513592 RepID=A0ABQ0MZU6_9GAMM|nr:MULTISPECIES: TM0106 family RecB-like putative nuclease [Colwellia]ALO34550.1 helicase [Colwellia sp. MT41]GAW97894.1 nuclease [Colwellia marinimaniae]